MKKKWLINTYFLLMFRSFHFSFFIFGHFWRRSYENTKILCNLYLHFARQDGQDRKKRRENHATKAVMPLAGGHFTKNQKTKIIVQIFESMEEPAAYKKMVFSIHFY